MPPRRVVSLACSNTEIVCALGCAERLVGVDANSDWPPEVVGPLPRVGRDLEIDVARVAALAPDLVLASLTVPGHERVVAALAAAGLPYLALGPVGLAGVLDDLRRIAGRLGVPARGEALAAGLDAAMPPVPPAGPRRPRIAVEWWPRPVILPGRLSWVHDLIERAGAENLLGEEPVHSRPVSDEELAARAPDAIVLAWCGVRPEKVRPDVVLANPALAATPAVRHRRVVAVPEAYLGRPSPRLAEGYRALRALVAALARPQAGSGGEEENRSLQSSMGTGRRG